MTPFGSCSRTSPNESNSMRCCGSATLTGAPAPCGRQKVSAQVRICHQHESRTTLATQCNTGLCPADERWHARRQSSRHRNHRSTRSCIAAGICWNWSTETWIWPRSIRTTGASHGPGVSGRRAAGLPDQSRSSRKRRPARWSSALCRLSSSAGCRLIGADSSRC